jgi:hypothetical protein
MEGMTMSAEGLWTIQFAQSEEDHGGIQVSEEVNRGGVLVLTNNKIYGGGVSFYFVGTYEESDAGISLTINATRYNDIVAAVFGTATEARLIFNGRIDGNEMTLNGNLEDEPDKRMIIKAERRTELN